jgi:hypothetical protein
VKKTRQNKKLEPRSDSIRTEKALAQSVQRFSLATNAKTRLRGDHAQKEERAVVGANRAGQENP